MPLCDKSYPDLFEATSPSDEMRKSNAGRKPLDAIVMFRMLVLQTLNNLSDEQVECRISRPGFVGLHFT